ncbi:MAG: class II aldolase/adducin family protein [Deltaproteobacteria bacterium]|nr:class II aldolase/adducin family protein [Deltaproteobacteria bacterium]
MTGSDARLRAEIVEYGHRLHARGWVANHDGNVSARAAGGQILCTPTATSKAAVTADVVVTLATADEPVRVIHSRARPPGEVNLHLAAYRSRPDVRAVLHAHPPTATGFGVAGITLLEQPVLAEAVVSLGPCIPTVPFAPPGAAAAAALAPFLPEHDAMLLAGNGVLVVGDSLEQAWLRLELVEHLARICAVAHAMGAVPSFPCEALPALLEARRKAGLGPEARGVATPARSPAAATALPASGGVGGSGAASARSGPDLARVIREEVERAMRRK